MDKNTTRRNFLITGVAMTGSIACHSLQKQPERQILASVTETPMPERILGNTGISVPILGLGGAGQTPLSWEKRESEAINIIKTALSLGIRYFDTAASYGPSEDYLGKVLPNYRNQVFLASKTAQRDRDSAWKELELSLKRLRTNYLDLWQLHHISFAEELEQIFSNNGAIKALEEAKEQKIIRFSGITGHHEPDVIAMALQRYSFDTTLIALNAADKHHSRPFISGVLPVAKSKNIGVIAMKVPAYGRLFKPGVLSGMEQAMGYALSLPGVNCCIIAAETVEQLTENVQVAKNFKPLNQTEMTAIEKLTAQAWKDNTFFRQWT